MAAWSGRGIPPTRRKLHRFREAAIRQRKAETAEHRADESRRDYTWSKKTRKAIVNPERFETLWCQNGSGTPAGGERPKTLNADASGSAST